MRSGFGLGLILKFQAKNLQRARPLQNGFALFLRPPKTLQTPPRPNVLIRIER